MSIFKSKKSLSIDFCSRRIKVIEGKFSKSKVTISKEFEVELPEDIYEDGVILNIHKLTETLEKELTRNKVSTVQVNGVINSSQIITREITMPKVSLEEIESILRYKMEEYIPIQSDDYVVQSIITSTFYEDSIEKYSILLVGVPKPMIQAHLNLFLNLNLRPNILDFQGNSIAKLINLASEINKEFHVKDKFIASIDIGFNTTKLTIVGDNSIKITRILDSGIEDILKDIEDEFGQDEKEGFDLLYNISMDTDYLEGTREKQVQDIVKNSFNKLMDDVDMIFRYFRTIEINYNIDLILLHGEIGMFNDIEVVFENYLGIKSTIFDSLENINIKGPIWKYANAIGGLRRMEEV